MGRAAAGGERLLRLAVAIRQVAVRGVAETGAHGLRLRLDAVEQRSVASGHHVALSRRIHPQRLAPERAVGSAGGVAERLLGLVLVDVIRARAEEAGEG